MYETEKIEREFLSLLLKHQDLVEDFYESNLNSHHFHPSRQVIVKAIVHSYESGVLLTRKSFIAYINKYISDKLQKAQLDSEFDYIDFQYADRHDYPMLKDKVSHNYLVKESTERIRNFVNLKDKNGIEHAVKDLAASMLELSTSSGSNKTSVVYEDIANIGEKHYQHMLDLRDGKVDEKEFISFGIDELDKTSRVGLAPGTLTLFCGDVGGFKSLASNCKITTYEFGDIEVGDVFDRIKKEKQSIHVLQYDEQRGNLKPQPILDVFDHGVLDCYKIKTRLGNEINCSAQHRNLFFNGYKRTHEVQIGDRIAVSRWLPFGSDSVSCAEATWLGMMLAEGGTSSHSYKFTNKDPDIVKTMYRASKSCGLNMKTEHRKGEIDHNGKKYRGRYRINSSRHLGRKYGLDGKLAIEKSISPSVFRWNKECLAAMLRAMYSGDGRFSVELSKKYKYKDKSPKRKYKIMYCTSSHQLAKDVRDILLRFGLISSIYKYQSYYKKDGKKLAEGSSWRVEISDAHQIVKFIKEIGFIGAKQKIARDHLPYLDNVNSNPNGDTIPADVWSLVNKKFQEQGKSRTGCRRHYRRGVHNDWKQDLGHCGNIGKDMSRDTLRKIAAYLDNDSELLAIANSDIYWDTIVSIEPVGKQQTYDLEMPSYHNFVCNNIVTHNSTQMLNVASNVWWQSKKNVLFIPLEMPEDLVYYKWLSRQTRTSFDLITNPKDMSPEQLDRITEFVKEKVPNHEAKFFIMDSYEQRTSVSLIKRMIEKNLEIFKPRVVVVDYIANLSPDTPMRGRNDLEIGEMLKDLRHMGRPGVMHSEGFAIISGAQIGRDALKRVRKGNGENVMFHSEDLRNSHEYSADADTIYAQIPDPQQPSERLQVFVVKSRYGKKTFEDGSTKALFEVKPAISYIRSTSEFYAGGDQSEILEKVVDDDDDFTFNSSKSDEDPMDMLETFGSNSEQSMGDTLDML